MRPHFLSFITEPYRAIAEISTLPFAYPILKRITPTGNGIIITVPGFTADDKSMYILRRFLTIKGYECFGWDQGKNTHIDPEMIAQFTEYVKRLHSETGEKLHLIGHSLGGIFAREVAKHLPYAVSSVITLGSPFNDPEDSVCSTAKYAYDMLNVNKPKQEIVEELLNSMKLPPECKTTCIYSKLDGIVHWTSCYQHGAFDNVVNVHLPVSHVAMAHHPLILHKIANILKNS